MKSWQSSASTSATIPSTSVELLAKAILAVSMNVLRIKGHTQDLYGKFLLVSYLDELKVNSKVGVTLQKQTLQCMYYCPCSDGCPLGCLGSGSNENCLGNFG